ncbi:MAG: hypothetical protein K2X57_00585 [Xanthobacteraceae bacterium]|nr:hypothetical protein [Xanthobacteraceae bacterium]
MSRKHPQNGPSLSKGPHKKQKPLDDKELAALQARQKSEEAELTSRVEEAREKVEGGKRFGAVVAENGGVIPIRGGHAEEFWTKIRRGNDEAASAAGKEGSAPGSIVAREAGETDDEYRVRSAALKKLLSDDRGRGRRV